MTENVRKELASIGIGNQTQSLGGDYEKAEAMSEDGYYVEALINKDKAVYKAELPDESLTDEDLHILLKKRLAEDLRAQKNEIAALRRYMRVGLILFGASVLTGLLIALALLIKL